MKQTLAFTTTYSMYDGDRYMKSLTGVWLEDTVVL